MQWPTDKDVKDVIRSQWTENAMANRKRCQRCNQKPMDRQCNGQQKKMSKMYSEANGQKMQRPTEKDVKDIIKSQWTDNAMSIGF
jgi:maltodextrin utilization protein YvdJ